MQSKAPTVAAYLAELPSDRRAALKTVREVILRNLDTDYEEGMQYGMIGYYVPHRIFPAGYHCDPKQPLPFAGLASQKNYMSLYLASVYCGCLEDVDVDNEHSRWFREAWAKTGKKLDMGKICIRFKSVDHLALDVIGEAIRRVPVKSYIAYYEDAMERIARNKAARTSAKKGSSVKKPVTKKKTALRASPKKGKTASTRS